MTDKIEGLFFKQLYLVSIDLILENASCCVWTKETHLCTSDCIHDLISKKPHTIMDLVDFLRGYAIFEMYYLFPKEGIVISWKVPLYMKNKNKNVSNQSHGFHTTTVANFRVFITQ